MAQSLDASNDSGPSANQNITTLRVIKDNELLAQQIVNGQLTVYQSQASVEDETAQQQFITLSREYHSLL